MQEVIEHDQIRIQKHKNIKEAFVYESKGTKVSEIPLDF